MDACRCLLLLVWAGVGPGTAGEEDRPAELPPLLPPPATEAPAPAGPRGPQVEYDHHYLYLPREWPPAAPGPPEVCRPLGRWWVNPALELAWVGVRPTAGTVRLPPSAGRPVLVLDTAGQAPHAFRPGFALSVGRFLDPTHTHALEGGLFFVADGARELAGRGPLPGIQVPATLATDFVSADANYRLNLLCSPSGRVDVLAGYRFAWVRDELYLGAARRPGSSIGRDHRLAASTPFHGGQIGLSGEYRVQTWYATATAAVAFGTARPDVTAAGPFAAAEGEQRSGSYVRLPALTAVEGPEFAVLPAARLTVGRQVGDHLRVFAGYSLLYLSRAIRLSELSDPAAPAPSRGDFWVQSLGLGLELRY